jgi:hypothetical protein
MSYLIWITTLVLTLLLYITGDNLIFFKDMIACESYKMCTNAYLKRKKHFNPDTGFNLQVPLKELK